METAAIPQLIEVIQVVLHTFLGKTHPVLGNFVKAAGNNRRALHHRLQIAGALLKGFSRGLATEAEHL